MFKVVSEKLVNCAVQRDIIKNDDIADCLYGLNAFFTLAINILSAVLIGMVMHMLFETILFISVYKSLRKYTGGSHSKTALRCYISSCITYVIVLIIIKYYPLSKLITVVLTLISCAVLYIISPVEAEKKPLDDIERRVFRHRSHISIIVWLCIFLFLNYVPIVYYTYYCSTIVSVSILTVTFFAITGKIHLNRKSKKAV